MQNESCDNKRREVLREALVLALGSGAFGTLNAHEPKQTQNKGQIMTRFDRGLAQLQAIDGEAGQKVIDSLANIAPDLGRFIIEFAFGDIYTRGELNLQECELITLSSLLTAGGCEPQLEVHINAALNVGIAPEKVIETFMQCIPYIGFPRVLNAVFVAKKVFGERNLDINKA
ncbi:MAG: carboxymuconolactone decarboxylase family protein [Helicobacter sp.]|nr:carboxymuconolactone decarboxylase family protein [Helicobacter sp.]